MTRDDYREFIERADQADADLIERAHEAFRDEYRRDFPPGGDEGDHYNAQRAGIEAVVVHVVRDVVDALRRQQVLVERGEQPPPPGWLADHIERIYGPGIR